MTRTMLLASLCALLAACGDKEADGSASPPAARPAAAPETQPAETPAAAPDRTAVDAPPADAEKSGLEKTVADLQRLLEDKLAAYEKVKDSNRIEAALILKEIADLRDRLEKAMEGLGD